MKHSPDNHRGTISRSFAIEDGPILPCAHNSKRFQAEWVVINWHLDQDGGWTIASLWDIDVSGSVLEEDGAPGPRRHVREPDGVTMFSGLITFTSEWAWIGELILQNAPIGKITLPVVS